MTHLTVKMELKKNFKSLQFSMVHGSLNPNITILGEKLWPGAWKNLLLALYKEKIEKWRKNENFEKQKNVLFFFHVLRITQPKN